MNPPSPVNSISPASIFANRPSSAPEAASSAAAREPSASARSARRSALVGLPLISVLMVVVTVIMIPSLGTITHTDHLTRPRGAGTALQPGEWVTRYPQPRPAQTP